MLSLFFGWGGIPNPVEGAHDAPSRSLLVGSDQVVPCTLALDQVDLWKWWCPLFRNLGCISREQTKLLMLRRRMKADESFKMSSLLKYHRDDVDIVIMLIVVRGKSPFIRMERLQELGPINLNFLEMLHLSHRWPFQMIMGLRTDHCRSCP